MIDDPLDPEWDDNPEWTEEDFARARPADEVHPPHIVRQLVRNGSRDSASLSMFLDAQSRFLDRQTLERRRAA